MRLMDKAVEREGVISLENRSYLEELNSGERLVQSCLTSEDRVRLHRKQPITAVLRSRQ